MKNNIQNFFLLISLLISIVVATLLWNKVNFAPASNIIENFPQSKYVQKNFHYLNEILRYCIFVFFPSLTYILFLIGNKKLHIPMLTKGMSSNNQITQNNESNLILFYFIILIFLLNFYFYKFPLTKGYWDGFHYGQYLTAGENYFHYKTLWQNSFITIGGGFEFLIPILSYKIFDSTSIAHNFSIIIFFGFLTQLILIFFAYKFSFNQKLSPNLKSFIFLILSIGIFILANFYHTIFVFREMPLLIFLIFLWFFVNKKNEGVSLFVLGIFSCLSVIWGLDRGAYFNFALLFFIFFLLINKQFKNFLLISFYIFVGWLMFYFSVGHQEFNHFLYNSKFVYLNTDHIYGLIHPTPFSFDSDYSRATKNLLLMVLASILTLKFCFNKSSTLSLSNKIFFVFLFFLAFISYKTGLGRSDRAHMRIGEAFCLFYLILILALQLALFIKKKLHLLKKINLLNNFLVIFLIALVSFFLFKRGLSPNNFNIVKFIKLENSAFLSEKDIMRYKTLSVEFKGDKCIQNLTNDSSIPYMISKPSCNKFYFPFSIAGKDIQKDYINLLIKLKTKRILIRDNYNYTGELNHKKKLDKIFKFLEEEYEIEKEIHHHGTEDYIILKKI
jgi:hypothetical protein